MSAILQKGDSRLREKAQAVPLNKIASPEIKFVIAEMSRALEKEPDGVALAAPQIGKLWRIFIVSGRTLSWLKSKKTARPAKFEEVKNPEPDLVFINPRLQKLSRKREWLNEGCLSVRWLYGEVRRAQKATVVAYNEGGRKIQMGAVGLLAQIFQHEIDHLDGVLFTDKAKKLKEVKPAKDGGLSLNAFRFQ